MLLRIFHISDLHFGPPYLPEVGAAVLDCARSLEADLIVASGDFTQRAKAAQFAEARRFLDQLPPRPLVVVPGNHDVPLYRLVERIRSPYMLYQQHIARELDSVLRLEQATVVALNTTAPLLRITEGWIRAGQLELCEQAFRETPPDAVRIVVAHHHFADAPDYVRDWPIHGAKRALARLASLGVELILGGHLHRAYVANSHDVYAARPGEPGIIIAQSGTATSSRGRARERGVNSLHWIEIDDRRVRIERYVYAPRLRVFRPFCRHEFPRPRLWGWEDRQ